MTKVVVVYDCMENNNDKSWIGESLLSHGYSVREIYPQGEISLSRLKRKRFGQLRVQMRMLGISLKAIFCSDNDTVIFVWNHNQALLLHEICLLFRRRRHIVSFLWLYPQLGRRAAAQKRCLEDENFVALTNSKELITDWKEMLHTEKGTILYFPDVYDPRDSFFDYRPKDEKYVFSGGFTNRDWKVFLSVVRGCPNISFKCIALQRDWDDSWVIPNNLEVLFDTSTDIYYSCMLKSAVTVYVCREHVSSGLINVIKSMQYGIIPIITYNDSVNEYYDGKYKKFLINGNSIDGFCSMIEEVINYSDQEYSAIVQNMQNNIKNEFSGEVNMERLLKQLNY